MFEGGAHCVSPHYGARASIKDFHQRLKNHVPAHYFAALPFLFLGACASGAFLCRASHSSTDSFSTPCGSDRTNDQKLAEVRQHR